MAYNFQINGKYTFNTLAPNILGAKFENVTLTAILDYHMANSYANVNIKHAEIFPLLPAGTSKDCTSYQYFVFKTQANEKIVLANVWIDEPSITQISLKTITLTFSNVPLSRLDQINEALLFNNLHGYTVMVS